MNYLKEAEKTRKWNLKGGSVVQETGGCHGTQRAGLGRARTRSKQKHHGKEGRKGNREVLCWRGAEYDQTALPRIKFGNYCCKMKINDCS